MLFKLNSFGKGILAICNCAFLAGLPFAGSAVASLARTLSLAEITKSAEIIADVTVQNVQSYWAAPAGVKAIRTRVSFLVLQSIKGDPGRTFALDFLGGEIDGRGLRVPDLPQFSLGERYILFCAAPGKALVCPVLGLDQGAIRVVHDNENNVDRVFRHWGQPVNSNEKFETRVPLTTGTTTRDYLRSADTVGQFLERVRHEAASR